MAIRAIDIHELNELTNTIRKESARLKYMRVAKAICGSTAHTVEVEAGDDDIEYIEVYDKDNNYLEFDFNLPIWDEIARKEWENCKDYFTLEEVKEGIQEDDRDNDFGQLYLLQGYFDLPYIDGIFTDEPILTKKFYIEDTD